MSDLKEILIQSFPEMADEFLNEQFGLSKEIISLRIMSQKSIDEFCEILNISKQDYVPFECGDTSIDIKLYIYLIKKIKNIFKKCTISLDE